MRGYHFYRHTKFELTGGWKSTAIAEDEDQPELVVAQPTSPGAPFVAAHAIQYYMPKEDSIRAGGVLYDRFERRVAGTIWLGANYAMLEIVDPPIHSLASVLGGLDGVVLTRLVVPNLKTIDGTLPAKTGRQVNNPTNPDRRDVFVYGDDVANDPTNQSEMQAGAVRMIQFGQVGETARVFDTATVLLMSYYDDELVAAQAAWHVWTTYLAAHAVPYQRGWRKKLES